KSEQVSASPRAFEPKSITRSIGTVCCSVPTAVSTASRSCLRSGTFCRLFMTYSIGSDLLHLPFLCMQVPATVEHSRLSAQVFADFSCFDLVYHKRLRIEHDAIILEGTLGRDKAIEHVFPHSGYRPVEGMAPATTTGGHDPQQVALTQAVIVAQWFELALLWGTWIHHNAPWTPTMPTIHPPGRKGHVLQPT